MDSSEELEKLVAQLQEQLHKDHACEEALSLRARVFSGGHTHIVQQCTVCGQQRGGPLSKANAARLFAGGAPASFDDTIEDRYRTERQALLQKFVQAERNLIAQTDPDRLEAMDYWAQERRESREQSATARARAEALIDEAVAAVRALPWQYRLDPVLSRLLRHHAAEFRDPEAAAARRFSSERELREWLDEWLQEDFEVFPEIWGKHLTEPVSVKIDYVIRPRQHLIDAGFKPGPIGLEVKYLPIEHGFSPKASRFIWQAVSYTDCEFELAGRAVRLPRVLLFSNMSFDDEYRLLRGLDVSAISNDKAKWKALLELANHANVGNLEIFGTRDNRTGWRIAFATGSYFRRHKGAYSLSDANLFEKVRIGNF